MYKLENFYIKFKLKTILQYCLVILAILQCNTVFFREYGTNHSKIVILLFIIIMIALFVLSFIESIKKRMNLKPLLIFLLSFGSLLIIFLVISYIRRRYSLTSIFPLLIPLFMVPIMYVDYKNGEADQILQRFKNIIVFLAVLSLIFWLLALLGFETSITKMVSWGGVRAVYGYSFLHYISQGSVSFLGLPSVIRNTGLFVEAPMYSYILCMAMLVSIFLKDNNNSFSWKTWVLMATILTTTSTTGVIIMVISIFVKLTFFNEKTHVSIKAFLIVLLIPILFFIISSVLNKKVDENWYSSSSIRYNDFVAGFLAWKDHPWLGNGFGNYNILVNNMDYRRLIGNFNTGFSTGFMEILAYGGIAAGLYYLLPTCLSPLKNKKIFAVSGISFLLFVFTLVNDVYAYYLFISYFWLAVLTLNKGDY
ncbi:O-antigen ligase family protein [Pediococcus acidilactici]|uniref:O-antigen ligase family protein n=3 Tax=Pediococcus acidilactici TaxID=1254 RepID=UPI00132C2078|nr:O-antigen ligase family protein [Pediococcus acidilactici]KAF0378348.1 hypothetical protein GBO63_08180 [Pediococcus acidilactici]KAF0565997.1 hypothetical protein GBP53_07570 [Pediococcus acidilactici]